MTRERPDPSAELRASQARRRLMNEYDHLPAELRAWLATAKLQWAPRSAARAWRRALWRGLGRKRRALELMDALEAERIAREGLPYTPPGPDRP
ncbi:DUF6525 family protein [uncultured Jannaschia sp.]|uniref:DUF6525 family protein n=1 Tax=uncultured Jannaschia sp. TaxID=293347 RepID=UPI0026179120|nr:DUF6525 family protein [uncultured Jannaschia sp.]